MFPWCDSCCVMVPYNPYVIRAFTWITGVETIKKSDWLCVAAGQSPWVRDWAVARLNAGPVCDANTTEASYTLVALYKWTLLLPYLCLYKLSCHYTWRHLFCFIDWSQIIVVELSVLVDWCVKVQRWFPLVSSGKTLSTWRVAVPMNQPSRSHLSTHSMTNSTG